MKANLFPAAFLSLLSFMLTSSVMAQDVMLQGWYWEYPKSPTTSSNFAVTLKNQMFEFNDAGFTHIWLPPLSRGSFGGFSNGYDPQDLFDLGEFGQGATGFGSRGEVDQVIGFANALGMVPIADVVYNHRDGGAWEDNPAVEGWIENMNFVKIASGDQPFPSDRWRCYLPLGGTTGNGAGDYYFKISSASQHPNFHNYGYTIYMRTNRVSSSGLPPQTESEPNGGGDCAQVFNDIAIGQLMNAQVDAGGCTVDEFKLTLTAADFFAGGDTVWIELRNTGSYSDHRIYSLWSASRSMDIQSEIGYQTATNFLSMPSGRGGMNYLNFKPNGNPTSLGGDLDFLWFFYDYDNSVTSTRDSLWEYTKWLWEDVDIRGFRLDAVKHFPPSFLGDMMSSLHGLGYTPEMVVGEFFDFNSGTVSNWINNVEASMDPAAAADIDIRAFDFGLRGALKEACDNPFYDLRNVYNSGLVNSGSASGYQVVTFVNNHDYRDPGQPVQNDPMLAHAYVLTNNHIGMPCVYYPDYYGVSRPNAPTQVMKPEIDALIKLQQDYIAGSTDIEYLNRYGTPLSTSYASSSADEILLYQLSGGVGGKDAIVAINFSDNPLDVDHQVNTTWMDLSVGDTMSALAGFATEAYAVIDGSSRLSLKLPAKSYAVWVQCAPSSVPLSAGDLSYCPDLAVPALSVMDDGRTFDWYDAATGGSLLQADSPSFTPSGAGTYYVSASGDGCIPSDRVAITLTNDPGACPCAVPDAISETVTGPSNVSLTWAPVGDALGYQLEGRVVGTPGWASINTASVGKNINVLMPATSYEWRIRSYCPPDFSDWSNTRIFTTPSARVASKFSVSIHPQPARETLTVSLEAEAINGEIPEAATSMDLDLDLDLRLTDLFGRLIKEMKVNSTTFQLDLAGLASGMYLLEVGEWSGTFEVVE